VNSPDPVRVRAVALFEMYKKVLPNLIGTLAGIRDRVDQVLQRQGVSRETWAAMSVTDREKLLRRDRKRR
jgi:hypothetical protein